MCLRALLHNSALSHSKSAIGATLPGEKEDNSGPASGSRCISTVAQAQLHSPCGKPRTPHSGDGEPHQYQRCGGLQQTAGNKDTEPIQQVAFEVFRWLQLHRLNWPCRWLRTLGATYHGWVMSRGSSHKRFVANNQYWSVGYSIQHNFQSSNGKWIQYQAPEAQRTGHFEVVKALL